MSKVLVASYKKFEKDETTVAWFELGQSDDELKRFLKEVVKVKGYRDICFMDSDMEMFWYDSERPEDIFYLNERFREYNKLNDKEKEVLEALLEIYGMNYLDNALKEAKNYVLLKGVKRMEDLGYLYLTQWGDFHQDDIEELLPYIDLKEVGLMVDSKNSGGITSKGYLLGN